MAFNYQDNGYLVPGIHASTWEDFVNEFGFNSHRVNLLTGLAAGMRDLASSGCSVLYVDGSFTTKKQVPRDFDACWELEGVNLHDLYAAHPIFWDFSDLRANQKHLYLGEFFPATVIADPITREIYRDFFQHDKDGIPKGIVMLTLIP